MTKQEAKQMIADTMRNMYRQGMVTIFEGNVSMRFEDIFLVSPSQTDKETMTADMIIEMDKDGNFLNPECGKKPTTEFKMHMQAYKICPWMQACVHNHSTFATAFAVANKPVSSNGLAESLEIFGDVPVIPYGRPGTPEIAAGFEKYLNEYPVLLLGNHGLFSGSITLQLAYEQALTVEKMAKIIFISNQLGGSADLPAEEVAQLKAMASKIKAYTRSLATK